MSLCIYIPSPDPFNTKSWKWSFYWQYIQPFIGPVFGEFSGVKRGTKNLWFRIKWQFIKHRYLEKHYPIYFKEKYEKQIHYRK